MPVHKCVGGWKWGESGKCYSTREEAERQARAIYASRYTGNSAAKNPLRADPTRTATLRRQFEDEMARRLARFRRKLVSLIVDEDAFGLRQVDQPFVMNRAVSSTQLNVTDPECLRLIRELQGRLDPTDVIELENQLHVTVRYGILRQDPEAVRKLVANVFCKTGEGGGVDPSCSPGGSGVGKKFSTMPNMKATSKEAKKWRKDHQKDYDDDPEFRAVVDGLTLFTQGDYSVQRAFCQMSVTGSLPEHYQDSALPGWVNMPLHGNALASYKTYFEGQGDFHAVESKHKRASHLQTGAAITNAIDSSPKTEVPLYRGVVGHHFVKSVADLKPGEDFDMLAPLSFTSDKEIGQEFAAGTAKGQSRGRKEASPYRVLIEVLPGARALPVSAISPWDQKELITSGRFKVHAVEVVQKSRYETVEQIKLVLRQEETWQAKSGLTSNRKGPPSKETILIQQIAKQERAFESELTKNSFGPVWMTLGRLSLFQHPDQDVLYLSVESQGLERLNAELGKLPHTDTHDDYVPHLTIARLKPGTGWKYLSDPSFLEWQSYAFTSLTFSDKKKQQTEIALNEQTQNTRWAFRSSPEKIKEFLRWLEGNLRPILTDEATTEDDWWNKYVQAGFKKGAARSYDDMKKAGAIPPSKLPFYLGQKDEFLKSAFRQPESVEKVKLLAGRIYTELKGVTEAMSQNLTRTLTDGLTQGMNPRQIATNIIKDVNGIGIKRARVIARTEIIRAHAEGQLDSVERLGVKELAVMAEWHTAGDARVCPLCSALHGIVVTIDEAKGLIPRHPQCRCAFIPANVGEDQSEQVRGAARIKKAIQKSLVAGKPKRGKSKSSWAGARRKISSFRPKSRV